MLIRKIFAGAMVLVLYAACGSDKEKDVDEGSLASCSSDSDCPSDEGCDTEGGTLSPGYCTPLCDDDGDCPEGYDCPVMQRNQPGECDDAGQHKGRGICDQYDGSYGPNTCESAGS